jgi:hypothetical protein
MVESSIEKKVLLVPILLDLGIVVKPLCIKTEKQPDGIPTVLLSNVPHTYNAILEKNNFSEYDTGWLVDASVMNEAYWERIFGTGLSFTMSLPEKVINSVQTPLYPPPLPVKSIIESFTNDHISWITKKHGVVGFAQTRLAQKRAIKGAYIYPEAWSIIKLAALTQIDRMPEDKETLAYLWEVSGVGKYDTSDVPQEVNITNLFENAIDRGLVTAGIEKSTPQVLKGYGQAAEWVAVLWDLKTLVKGRKNAGTLDVEYFEHKVDVCKYLLENKLVYRIDEVIESDIFFTRSNELAVEQQPIENLHWVDEVVNEVSMTAQRNAFDAGHPVTEPQKIQDMNMIELIKADNKTLLTWEEALEYMALISKRKTTLMPIAKSFYSVFFGCVFGSDRTNTFSKSFYVANEEFLRLLNNIQSADDLMKTMQSKSTLIKSLCNLIAHNNDSLFHQIRKLTRNPQYAASIARGNLSDGLEYWWGDGFRIYPSSSNNWLISKIKNNGDVKEFIDKEFTDYQSAISMVKYYVKKGNILPVKNLTDDWFVAYAGSHGGICIIDSTPKEFKGDARYVISANEENILNESRLTPFFTKEIQRLVPIRDDFIVEVSKIVTIIDAANYVSTEYIANLLLEIENILELDELASLLAGELAINVVKDNWQIQYRGVCVFDGPIEGVFIYAWARAYYSHLSSQVNVNKFSKLFYLSAKGTKHHKTIDRLIFSIDNSKELTTLVGSKHKEQLKEAIIHPSRQHHNQVMDLFKRYKKQGIRKDLEEIICSCVTTSRQYSSRRKLTPQMKHAFDHGLSKSDVFAATVMYSAWHIVRWKGKGKALAWLVSAGLNSHFPSLEIFPEKYDFEKIKLIAVR